MLHFSQGLCQKKPENGKTNLFPVKTKNICFNASKK